MKRIIFPLAAIALGGPAIGQDEKPISETCPNLTAEEIEEIENYKGQFSENAWYARSQCVSVEEAERRMEIQNRGAIGPRTEPGPRHATALISGTPYPATQATQRWPHDKAFSV